MSSSSRLAIPDVNVLVALTNPAHVFHTEAHRWLGETEHFATTPVTESALVRLLLNPRVTGQSVTTERALGVLAGIRSDTRAVFLLDDTSLADLGVDATGLVGHQQVTDWHLLNVAVRHDAVLVTFDRRLARAVLPEDADRLVLLG